MPGSSPSHRRTSRGSPWRCSWSTPASVPKRPLPSRARSWMRTCCASSPRPRRPAARPSPAARRRPAHRMRAPPRIRRPTPAIPRRTIRCDRNHRLRTHAPYALRDRAAALRAQSRRAAAGGARAALAVWPHHPLQRLGPGREHHRAHRHAPGARRRGDARADPCQAALPAPPGAVAVCRGDRAAVCGGGPRRHRQGRAALAESRAVSFPALRDHEGRGADARRLVSARASAAAGLEVAGGARADHLPAGGPGGDGAGSGHRGTDHRRRTAAGTHGRSLDARHPDRAAAGRRRGGGGLEFHARLPARARADLSKPADRPARCRLPHHPEPDRHRLGWCVRQGLDEWQPGAAGFPARTLHRLHLFGRRRGVRPHRPGGAAGAVPVHRVALPVAGAADQRYLLAPARPEPGADLLRLCVHQRRHGQRPAARGRRAAAAGELRWDFRRDLAGRLRYSHGPVFTSKAGGFLTLVSRAVRFLLLASLGMLVLPDHGAHAASPVPTSSPGPSASAAAPSAPAAATAPASAPADLAPFDVSRPEIRSFIAEAQMQGVPAERVIAALRSAEPQPQIVEAMSRPAEKTLQWWEYRARMLTPARIAAGAQLWREHKELLDQVAIEYGVPPEYLVAVLGVETL